MDNEDNKNAIIDALGAALETADRETGMFNIRQDGSGHLKRSDIIDTLKGIIKTGITRADTPEGDLTGDIGDVQSFSFQSKDYNEEELKEQFENVEGFFGNVDAATELANAAAQADAQSNIPLDHIRRDPNDIGYDENLAAAIDNIEYHGEGEGRVLNSYQKLAGVDAKDGLVLFDIQSINSN